MSEQEKNAKSNEQEAQQVHQEEASKSEETTASTEDAQPKKEISAEEETSKTSKTSEDASKEVTSEEKDTSSSTSTKEEEDDVQKELDDANAEDSEDQDVGRRHEIAKKDYESMSLDELVIELENLLKNEKVQAIREHVSEIKANFDKQFNEIVEEKKETFIAEGGNIIDFHYSSPIKKKFNSIYFEYREKRDAHYSQLKKNLNQNLQARLSIIEELKNMIGSGESMGTTFKQFKELQERWKNAGPVPKNEYNNVWKNYHHHVERFYDFLHLDREFRDLDFKYNLDQKLKIIERAEELAEETDINRAFRELQLLHKMWKEELGPVAKEFRDDIWDKFSEATKKIHQKRQAYFDELDQEREKNYEVKKEVIEEIKKLADKDIKSHNEAQQRIKHIEKLREIFFSAGKAPRRVNDQVWDEFKTGVRDFNRKKNAFYKELKKEQFENLKKKEELLKIAEDNKDSVDYDTVTPVMKRIQLEWKKIGHVPRKDSDKIWKRFKKACNTYFDRLHKEKNKSNDEEFNNFITKKDFIGTIKKTELPSNQEEALKTIKSYIEKWGEMGNVPNSKRYIEGKFNKVLDQLFNRIDIDKKDAELIKYDNRLHNLEETSDHFKINKEASFLRKKIDETKDNINQFENNLQFFSTQDESNPLVKEVIDNINKLKDELEMWKEKLSKLRDL
ncbi:MAG: DUF349 domain-containing protein [Flavobacteriaceae bacterium]|nr:DUF349 domain-containing protein [Flavobacteriaceae bacterium]